MADLRLRHLVREEQRRLQRAAQKATASTSAGVDEGWGAMHTTLLWVARYSTDNEASRRAREVLRSPHVAPAAPAPKITDAMVIAAFEALPLAAKHVVWGDDLKLALAAALSSSAAPAHPAPATMGMREVLEKIDEARKSVWKSYRHLAAREVALMNDAYDAVAALAPATEGRKG